MWLILIACSSLAIRRFQVQNVLEGFSHDDRALRINGDRVYNTCLVTRLESSGRSSQPLMKSRKWPVDWLLVQARARAQDWLRVFEFVGRTTATIES
jgi:hypothetical protein